MFIKKHPFAIGFWGTIFLFLILNLIAIHINSDCGLLFPFCLDDLARVGFPIVFWESATQMGPEVFKGAALILDIIITIGMSLMTGYLVDRRDRRAES